jgi:three-Cys-motif partner protein
MPRDNHHVQPFDEGTRTKLFIYKSYLQAWLQVFTHTRSFAGRPLQFFDFFAGPGQDSVGNSGSPVILLDALDSNRALIRSTGRNVVVLFNDHDPAKTDALRAHCQRRGYNWQPEIYSNDFAEAYARHGSRIGEGPSLVFLDQFGVKFVTRTVFSEIAQRPQTDLLFFFASSHQRRFDDQFSNELHVPEGTPYTLAHRVVADQYRQWAPQGYFVGHFSIKKGSNVYGLIFGSGHSLGMYRFLEIAWTVDAETGEANFRIEADCDQATLFGGFQKTKIDLMEDQLKAKITSGDLTTDAQVVMHCITAGVLPSKVVPGVYRELKDQGVLANASDLRPRYSYEAVRTPRTLLVRRSGS